MSDEKKRMDIDKQQQQALIKDEEFKEDEDEVDHPPLKKSCHSKTNIQWTRMLGESCFLMEKIHFSEGTMR